MKVLIITGIFTALWATGLGLAGAAAAKATLTGTESAADTVNILQGQGYKVQINGYQTTPLTRCNVTDIHGLPKTDPVGEINPPRSSRWSTST